MLEAGGEDEEAMASSSPGPAKGYPLIRQRRVYSCGTAGRSQEP